MDKMGDKALSSTSDNDNMLVDVRTMLKKVEDSLPRILAVIHAAEGKPIRSQVLVNWLRELKDAAYEADDVLDEFDSESFKSRKTAARWLHLCPQLLDLSRIYLSRMMSLKG
ncbi:hypothetical protein MUK42_06175 [Musa troglodytarum]|uniref:Disease resistance N-terminal domain-containing protein n=1 Tax=Musa troglodytarum TaxID=320322 RepID=A0A9E7H3W4_9LILI|nr:hypothetical protein MUK42_06175 [Musa troglodytarum]